MDIESKDKATIRNFCEDFRIETVPNDKCIAMPIAVIDEVYEGEPQGVQRLFNGPIRATNFKLRVDEDSGVRLLVVEYDSDVMMKHYEMIADMYESVDHEPDFTFVIAHHYEGDHDLDNLSYHFNRYMPFVTTSGDISGLYDDTELNSMMLGYDESPE